MTPPKPRLRRLLSARTLNRTRIAYSRIVGGYQPIYLEYPVSPMPRYGSGRPPHPMLNKKIEEGRNRYRSTLASFLDFSAFFSRISLAPTNPREPHWCNDSIPPLDAMALYALLGLGAPKRYVEIGSGHSTKFAKRAIRDLRLSTSITSIDPLPRADVDSLCDTVVREPLENNNLAWSEILEPGDILFFDGSHRSFENSDVTVFFLDVLPRLRSGVLVEIHDIFLPFDYPSPWNANYWSEQYLLAVYLLAGDRLEVVLPNAFVGHDEQLCRVLDPLWSSLGFPAEQRAGVSFWARTR